MGQGMNVRTDFPRFDENYTVSVEERKPGAKPVEGQNKTPTHLHLVNTMRATIVQLLYSYY